MRFSFATNGFWFMANLKLNRFEKQIIYKTLIWDFQDENPCLFPIYQVNLSSVYSNLKYLICYLDIQKNLCKQKNLIMTTGRGFM